LSSKNLAKKIGFIYNVHDVSSRKLPFLTIAIDCCKERKTWLNLLKTGPEKCYFCCNSKIEISDSTIFVFIITNQKKMHESMKDCLKILSGPKTKFHTLKIDKNELMVSKTINKDWLKFLSQFIWRRTSFRF